MTGSNFNMEHGEGNMADEKNRDQNQGKERNEKAMGAAATGGAQSREFNKENTGEGVTGQESGQPGSKSAGISRPGRRNPGHGTAQPKSGPGQRRRRRCQTPSQPVAHARVAAKNNCDISVGSRITGVRSLDAAAFFMTTSSRDLYVEWCAYRCVSFLRLALHVPLPQKLS